MFLVALFLSLGAPVYAANVTYCFKAHVSYLDSGKQLLNGVKEDYWNAPGEQYARGAKVVVSQFNGPTIWSGYLYDGLNGPIACTPPIDIGSPNNKRVLARIYTRGVVQGNTINVQNKSGELVRFDVDDVTYTPSTVPTEPKWLTVTTEMQADANDRAALHAFMGVSYGLYRHAAGLSGEYFDVRTGQQFYNEDGVLQEHPSHYSAGVLCLSTSNCRRKFTVTHELGHNLLDFAAGDTFGGDYGYNAQTAYCDFPGNHQASTIEWQEAAFAEGFADFYSADVWNNHAQADCRYSAFSEVVHTCKDATALGHQMVRPAIDCEAGSADQSDPKMNRVLDNPGCITQYSNKYDSFPQAYMVNRCTMDAPYTNKGVQVDWLRLLWDMHSGADGIPMNSLIDWIGDSLWGFNWNTYAVELDNGANSVGGALDSKWDQYKYFNGVMQ
jgi:hypothetical protein